MTDTVIPCKRPKVTVAHNHHTSATHCLVPGCGWTYGPGVKSDVEQQASWHRSHHRGAVPKTEIVGPTVNLGYRAICACGWMSPDGTVTRTDNEAALASHLSSAHGLVTCP